MLKKFSPPFIFQNIRLIVQYYYKVRTFRGMHTGLTKHTLLIYLHNPVSILLVDQECLVQQFPINKQDFFFHADFLQHTAIFKVALISVVFPYFFIFCA